MMSVKKLVLPAILIATFVTACNKGNDEILPSGIQPDDTFLNTPNEYSWDGSWTPSGFPLDGLYDDLYNKVGVYTLEGNVPSPILPPGDWDWQTSRSMANYRNFSSNVGTFEGLFDPNNNQYGWKFIPNNKDGVDANMNMDFVEGSSGMDIFDLGPNSKLHTSGGINFGNGITMFTCKSTWTLDLRTGSSESLQLNNDNDLVILGSDNPVGKDVFDISTTTIHTGPGRDIVFVSNMQRAAIDLGNGNSGRTDALDPNDKGDMVIIDGNQYDCRFFGGNGNDIFIWYIENSNHSRAWIGSNLYGTGGYGEAQWSNDKDRLVLVVDDKTEVINSAQGPTPAGTIRVWQESPFPGIREDEPMKDNVYARYHTSYRNKQGRTTMLIEYRYPNGETTSGYMSIVSFEELQVGIGSQASVYKIDDINGTIELADESTPLYDADIPKRQSYRNLFTEY